MNKSILLGFLLILLPVLVYSGLNVTVDYRGNSSGNQSSVTSSSTIWVPDNYTTIQGAINSASVGDIIIVRNGTYYENVLVNKTVQFIGEDFPIVNGSFSPSIWGYPTLEVVASNVTISGFIIQHGIFALREYDDGVWLFSDSNNISANIIRSNLSGIKIGWDDQDNYILGNIIQCNGDGIFCAGRNSHIVGNVISNNSNGIEVWYPINSLINNTITWNSNFGIYLSAYEVTLRGNNMSINKYNFGTVEYLLPQLFNDIDTSNTINGKPIYYLIDQSDKALPSDAGYVAIINSTNITVEGLTLENNGQGVLVAYSSNITVENCNLINNWWGVRLWSSSNTSLYQNNIIDSYIQYETNSENLWDDSYPSGGNYWSDYTGIDENSGLYKNETGSDGIGDTAYSQDRFPLMAVFSSFNTSLGYYVNVISNSTIDDFDYFESNSTMRMHVLNSSLDQMFGFCRICIPYALMSEPYNVTINGSEPYYVNYNLADNGTHRWIYFSYAHSTLEIVIVPEFPLLLILPLFMMTTLLVAIVYAHISTIFSL